MQALSEGGGMRGWGLALAGRQLEEDKGAEEGKGTPFVNLWDNVSFKMSRESST